MEYSKLISISGMSGLFEVLGSKTDGAIVRSLENKNTQFVSSRIHNFSQLESIEIFTIRENVNLVEIFQAMDKSLEKTPAEKDTKAIKSYFEKIYADIDFEKVYTSDMKKIIKWYGILNQHKVELKLTKTSGKEEPTKENI